MNMTFLHSTLIRIVNSEYRNSYKLLPTLNKLYIEKLESVPDTEGAKMPQNKQN